MPHAARAPSKVPDLSRSEGVRLAEAYLSADDNRATHRRAADIARLLTEKKIAGVTAAEYMAGLDHQNEVTAELAPLVAAFNVYMRRPVQRILDAGSGIGTSALALAHHYPGAQVTGVEIEEPAVALARHLARDESRVQFACARLENFVPATRFDLIQCRAVLEHVFDPPAVMASLLDWLEPGGVLYVETPNYRWPWETHLRLPMLPKGPKSVVRLEARWTGRDAGFVDHLNFECDPATLRRWVWDAEPAAEIVDLMAEKVRAIFAGAEMPRVHARARAMRGLKRLPALARGIEKTLLRLELTPSVMLIVAKPAAAEVSRPRPDPSRPKTPRHS
jgi:2-polyprenyl-3-methyl-5-hydroxy-6-metoxy-1,4-benzoquinol methylase